MKHYNIPVFIPEIACPNKCVFCSQNAITDTTGYPSDNEVIGKIETYLNTIPTDAEIEVAFFGGNFTGIPFKLQERFLRIADKYVQSGRVSGVRLSTRPDYITSEVMEFLSFFKINEIELGAQSFNNDVLELSGRGHTSEDTIKAASMIKECGIRLGLQMMTGLPGDSPEGAISTAVKIIDLGADSTRIYPLIVLENTELEAMYKKGEYIPQDLEETVNLCARIYGIFETAGVKVLKTGLHPSESITGGAFIAGPYHPSFSELVQTKLWKDEFESIAEKIKCCRQEQESFTEKKKLLVIYVNPKSINSAAGYGGSNRKKLSEIYGNVSFKADYSLKAREYYVLYS